MVSRFYFQRDDGTVSDSAFFEKMPDDKEGGVWVEGVPADNKIFFVEKSMQQIISELFAQLSKESRIKLRPFVTDGFVALAANNPISIQDILSDVQKLELNNEETTFIQTIQSALGL